MIHFNAQHGLIIVRVTFVGPTGSRITRLALDTGATSTIVSKEILMVIGYDLDALPQTVQMTTGSSVETATRLLVDKIEALGEERLHFPVIAHTLPPTAAVDGLLGLDFFRGHVLTLDFASGEITLA